MASINELLFGMIEENGSDLHLMSGRPPRIRLHGDLVPIDMPPFEAGQIAAMIREICPPEKWEIFRQSHDLDFSYAIPGRARFRCNFFEEHRGVAAVFRLIPQVVQTIKQLHLPQTLADVCDSDRGLILVTGPTGSGKSTTLAAMIHHINSTTRKKIVTVEDPLEFTHRNHCSIIEHREVGRHCTTFAQALHSAMRSDPDIVMVGEMRDLETIRTVLNCASMGMLVFGTLHTNGAAKTVDRIIKAFPANEQAHIRTMLAESLTAVVSQLLCRRCDKPGRIAALEILVRTAALANAIREGLTSGIRTIIESGSAHGMIAMDAYLEKLLTDGCISPEEAYRNANVKKRFRHYLDPKESPDENQNEEENTPLAEIGLDEITQPHHDDAIDPGPEPRPENHGPDTP